MILSERLQKGDTIGVIAPASPPDMNDLKRGICFFEQLGLRVKLGRHIDEVYGYLAGTDEQRLADFHEMIADPSIKGIIFARGGYGTGRIASDIDYQLVEENPKIIWGYSDITYIHTTIRQATGLVTFHGPMVESDVAKDNFDELSAQLFQQLFTPTRLHYSEQLSSLKVMVSGEASGELVGGNLSLLVSTLGTPHEIETRGKLVLMEDIGEEPYRVDAMLNQLKLAGKLKDAAGIIIGDFAKSKPKKEKPSLTLEQVFHHYFDKLSCPVMSGFKIGHCMPHFAVPLGVQAMLSTYKKSLTIEAGVK
ncbi:S66 peptidase family protein [Virgibacillus oceani]|nr:LD-carboxypeptidase [Virgibacillus oceani]